MQRPSDEMLVAYLDGELDDAAVAEVEASLVEDPEAAARLKVLAEATDLVRRAFDHVLREEVPARLLASANGRDPAGAEIVAFPSRRTAIQRPRAWIGMAAAACLAVGAFVGYDAGLPGTTSLDTIATYHNLFIGSAEAHEEVPFDVTPAAKGNLPRGMRVPDSKPWGLDFIGARKLVVEGKPAFQFYYMTDKRDLGAITITLWSSRKPESERKFDQRDNVNLMSWHHAGRGIAIVGHADKGYMWSLANDVEYQLEQS